MLGYLRSAPAPSNDDPLSPPLALLLAGRLATFYGIRAYWEIVISLMGYISHISTIGVKPPVVMRALYRHHVEENLAHIGRIAIYK